MPSRPSRISHPETLTQRVVDAYGIAIVSGTLPEGSILDVTSLPDDLQGVSRTVWREAIGTLSSLGLSAAVKRKGTLVLSSERWSVLDVRVLGWIAATKSTLEVMRLLHGFREIIEPAAAYAAAKYRTQEQLDRLKELLSDLIRLSDNESDDPEIDVRFHAAVIDAAGNRLMSGVKQLIADALRFSLGVTLNNTQQRQDAIDWHRNVVIAIENGEPDAAHAAMLLIINQTYAPWMASASEN